MPRGKTPRRPSDCCSVIFLRYALYSFNSMLLFTGLTLLAFGIWTLLEKSDLFPLLSPLFTISVYATCIVGGVILVASVVGCQGAIQEKHCSMVSFTVLLVLIFVCQVGTGVMSYVVYMKASNNSLTYQMSTIAIKSWDGQDTLSSAIDNIHMKYKCCGAVYYTDWQNNELIRSLNTTTPDSCCITVVPDCGKVDHPSNLHTQGCATFVEEDISLSIILIPALNLGFSIIQIFGVVFACAFTHQMLRKRRFVKRSYHY